MPPIDRERPTQALTSAQPDLPVYRDAAEEAADRASLAGQGASPDFAARVAALTESPREAEIDLQNGLHGAAGRRPVPEDFADVLSPEGNSGDVFGADVDPDAVWVIGEDGSTGRTL